MYLVKLNNGHFAPYDTEDHDKAGKIPVGDVVKASKARNYLFLKKYFALLKLGFDNIDTQDSKEIHRMKVQMRAGYVVWSKDKGGNSIPFPESISFDKMTEERFNMVYDAVLNVISEDLGTDTDTINEQIEGFYN